MLRVLGDLRGLAVPGIPVHLPEAAASEVADCFEGSLRSHLLLGGLKASFTAGNHRRTVPARLYFRRTGDAFSGNPRNLPSCFGPDGESVSASGFHYFQGWKW